MKAELRKGFLGIVSDVCHSCPKGASPHLLVDVEFPEYLGRIQQVGVVHDSTQPLVSKVADIHGAHSPGQDVLLDVPCQQWQVQDQGQPVSVDEEEEG